MDYSRIDHLLKAYWEGDTTLEEEKELHTFFEQNDLPDAYQATQQVFRYFANARLQKRPTTQGPPIQEKNPLFKKLELRTHAVRMAAVIVILIALGWGLSHKIGVWQNNPSPEVSAVEDTYEDPDLAYQQTKEALMYLSAKLHSGLQYQHQMKKLHDIDKRVEKNEQ